MRIFAVYLLMAISSASLADTISGKVVGIADGDTITVLASNNEQFKIRLNGVDAPEKAQPFGQASKKSISTHRPADGEC